MAEEPIRNQIVLDIDDNSKCRFIDVLEDDVDKLVAQTRYDLKIVLKCLRKVRKEEREMEKIPLEVIHWCLCNKQNLI